MKRKVLTLSSVIIATFLLISFTAFETEDVEALSDQYAVDNVYHTIKIMYNGYIFINDTIQINGTAPNDFLVGFPYMYGSRILECVAYYGTARFPVTLDVPLEDGQQPRVGFYGVKIDFPQGAPRVFNVVFVLSNDLVSPDPRNMSRYILSFPEYPSLTTESANCTGRIFLPKGSTYRGGTVEDLTYSREDLPAFTFSPADVAFEVPEEGMKVVDIGEMRRRISINGVGEIKGSDTYHIENRGTQEVSFFEVILPKNAPNPSAHDLLGRILEVDATEEANRYRVSFRLPLETGESYVFTVEYYLPGEGYIEQKENGDFDFTFDLFYNLNYYINQSSTTFVLPEGAEVLGLENASAVGGHSVTEEVFQEALTINKEEAFLLKSFGIKLTYGYDLLWLSFRPTLWIWVLVTVGCAVAFVWRKPKAAIPVTAPEAVVGVTSGEIRSFVDAYERKRKIIPKLKSLQARARKGKISRRRYKVRRKTLETRLQTLSRELDALQEKLLEAGGRYRDLMRRLEIAETEINEAEANIESIGARHRRGELSLGAYRKLLSEYEQRKDRAETTINEILIRLRE